MATYQELFDLESNSALRNRTCVACTVEAQLLIDAATPTAAQLAWARATLADPMTAAQHMLRYLLAANKTQTVAFITQTMTDAQLQSGAHAAVLKLTANGA